uniref:Uncharacterized protein n=1 Tax=Anguilla anguilla TaxID=7936 RepID=A0A0E9SEQ4_ANGAN
MTSRVKMGGTMDLGEGGATGSNVCNLTAVH